MSLTLDLIIATHNRASLLAECLASVQAARFPASLTVRVLVVDNNSTDNTGAVAAAHAHAGAIPVDYLFVSRPGKSAALNEAVARTHADLIGFIDDDERIDAEWFRVVEREFAGLTSPDYIGGPYLPDWESAAPEWLPANYRGAIGIMPLGTRGPFRAGTGSMLMGGNAVIRRPVLEKVLPYPEHLGKIGTRIRSGEDEVIFHRLLASGAYGLQVPDLLIYHWIPAARLTKKYFRNWVLGRGIAQGWQFRERGFSEAGLFGVPRYLLGTALRAIPKWLTGRSVSQRFTAELTLLDSLAMLYGRHTKQR